MINRHHSSYAAILCLSASLLGLAACGLNNPLSAQRPEQQSLVAPRRTPALNNGMMAPAPVTNMVAPAPAMAAPMVTSATPFDSYDSNGNIAAPQPARAAAPAPVPEKSVRKSFADHAYNNPPPPTAKPLVAPVQQQPVAVAPAPMPVEAAAPVENPRPSIWQQLFPAKAEPATEMTVRRGIIGEVNPDDASFAPANAPWVESTPEAPQPQPSLTPQTSLPVAPTSAIAEPTPPVMPVVEPSAPAEKTESKGWFSNTMMGRMMAPAATDAELSANPAKTPSLSSVPPVPEEFAPAKAAHESKMDELRADQKDAQSQKQDLGNEPSQTAAPEAAAAPAPVAEPNAQTTYGAVPAVGVDSKPVLLGHATGQGLAIPPSTSLPAPKEEKSEGFFGRIFSSRPSTDEPTADQEQ